MMLFEQSRQVTNNCQFFNFYALDLGKYSSIYFSHLLYNKKLFKFTLQQNGCSDSNITSDRKETFVLGEVFSNLAQLRLGQSESASDGYFNRVDVSSKNNNRIITTHTVFFLLLLAANALHTAISHISLPLLPILLS